MVSSFSTIGKLRPAHFKLWPSLRTADGSLQRQRKREDSQSGSNSPGTGHDSDAWLKFINPNHDNWAPVLVLPTVDRRRLSFARWRFLLQSEPDKQFHLGNHEPAFRCDGSVQQLFDDRAFFCNPTPGSGTTPTTYLAVFTENPYLPTRECTSGIWC